MSDQEEYGPWIDHDGTGVPPYGEYLRAEFGDGRVLEGIVPRQPVHGSWGWLDGYEHVIRYRIRKPRGMSILTDILSEVERDGGKVYDAREMEGVNA